MYSTSYLVTGALLGHPDPFRFTRQAPPPIMQVPVAAATEGHQVAVIMYGRVFPSAHALGNDVVPVQVADVAANLTV